MESDIDFDRIFRTWQTDCISTFNLILTTLVVFLPKAFAEVGSILGFSILCIIALFSYCSSTFILEVQSIYGALKNFARQETGQRSNVITPTSHFITTTQIHASYNPADRVVWNINHTFTIDSNSRTPSDSQHEIAPIPSNATMPSQREHSQETNNSTKPYETIGELLPHTCYDDLCQRFLQNQICLYVYRIAICLYLYGIIAIYLIAITKSLTSIVCFDPFCFMDEDKNDRCKIFPDYLTIDIYRYVLIVIVFIVSSFTFLKLPPSKTLTSCMVLLRWCAFLSMIVLAFSRIAKGLDDGPENRELSELYSISIYIGICMNVFMIQFLLPNEISNSAVKDRFPHTLRLSYIIGVTVLTLILITAVFAFTPSELQDIYSLNFTDPNFFRYFLELFPVYSSSVFIPALGISLRKTIKTMMPWTSFSSECNNFIIETIYQLLTMLPPITIAFISCDIDMLVSYTGLFSGGCCGFVVPVILIHYARKETKKTYGKCFVRYSSPFQHSIWLLLLLIWYLTCFGFMLYCNFKGAR